MEPFHPGFIPIIAVFLSVLEIKYQGRLETPFETHFANMLAFLLSALTYSLAFVVHTHTQNATYLEISSYVGAISGLLALSSLISILLQQLSLLVFILWAFVLMILSCRDLFHHIYLWFYRRVVTTFHDLQRLIAFYLWFYWRVVTEFFQGLRAILYRAWRQNLEQQRPRLPV